MNSSNLTDEQLFRLVKEQLNTSVIGDIMDKAGLYHQFLPANIRAMVPGTMIVGRAMPVLQADCYSADSSRSQPFGLMFEALDDLKPGEIYVCSGGSYRFALWGGLMSTRAKELGANGAVLGGFHRDTNEILGLGFPVFSTGGYGQDQQARGRVIDYRCPVEFENSCRVEPGDLIVGDVDGVVVVPKAREREFINQALQKIADEKIVSEKIKEGKSAAEMFALTGIM